MQEISVNFYEAFRYWKRYKQNEIGLIEYWESLDRADELGMRYITAPIDFVDYIYEQREKKEIERDKH